MSRNQCLLWYGRCSCGFYNRYSMWLPCISTQLSALRRTEARSLTKISGFTWMSWQAFCARWCNTSKSLIGAEQTKVFWCPHSQNSRRDRGGQRNGPPRSTHCSPKVWLRCCLTMQRKSDGGPSCMNHMCCRWWRGTFSKITGKSFTKNDGTLHLLFC
jgi:hypothetical protein